MGDVAIVQRGHGDDRDGSLGRELHGLLVDLGEIRVKGSRHRVLGRDLVHTVGHDRESVSVEGHIREEHEHLLVLVNGEVLGGRKSHIRNQKPLDWRVFGRVDETDDPVEGSGALERLAEEEVVIVRQTHTAEDDLVHIGSQGHIGHNLVVRLVRVGEERNLLSGHDRVVEVDAGDTGRNELGRLASLVRVHGRSADLPFLTLYLWTAIDRLSVGVEETSGELIADLECRRLAEECHLSVCRNAFRAGEHLEGDQITLGLHDLGKFAADHGKLVIGNSLGLE